ncbi:MAG: hypothetical protein ABIH85_00110 [Candidatus Omnitrophota bacterium]
MSIDISKLENVRNAGNKTVARCPACAELGQDKKGNHLVINSDGKFACVMFQGVSGHEHRKRIFRLVGIKEPSKNTITVKQVSQASHDKPEIVMDDVLGRIGRIFLSYPKKQEESKVDKIVRLYENMNGEVDHSKRTQKEQVFKVRWDNLPEMERKALVARLLDKRLLPDIVKQALDIFDGTVVSLV